MYHSTRNDQLIIVGYYDCYNVPLVFVIPFIGVVSSAYGHSIKFELTPTDPCWSII